MRLLVVEDEPNLLQAMVRRLKEEGYGVDGATDGEEALAYVATVAYDAIILDLMLPRLSGLEVLREMRNRRLLYPVLILTARDATEDKVKGLDLGADDYLTKPFSFDELLARLRAILRRAGQPRLGTVLKAADLEVDTIARKVTRAGQTILLTSKEYALLEYLIRNQGQVLTRSQIAEHVWDYDFNGMSNIVDVYIRYLRRKIDDPFEPKLIQTIRGSGYRLEAP
ncbi:MAG: response regulator transcription factor [Clostridia bacterium]|nr:response regulator transcription factor [Clostridia bacterium]